ncbi:8711_t:CDS:1, partial [Dentiscutata erythropus]
DWVERITVGDSMNFAIACKVQDENVKPFMLGGVHTNTEMRSDIQEQ